jgi:hypothetical protein
VSDYSSIRDSVQVLFKVLVPLAIVGFIGFIGSIVGVCWLGYWVFSHLHWS